MKKSAIMLLVAASLTTSFSGTSVNASSFIDSLEPPKTIEDLSKETRFKEELNRSLKETFGDDYQLKLEKNEKAVEKVRQIEEKFERDEIGEAIYPDYLGGLYIDGNDNLIIQVVDKNVPKAGNMGYKKYKSTFDVDKELKVVHVNYSYEELNETSNELVNKYLGKMKNLTGVYVDVILNKVVVELKDLSNRSKLAILKIVKDPAMISFDKSVDYAMISNINPGQGFVTQFNKVCSYGYRAKFQGSTVGIVTAGHCFDGIGNQISNIGIVIRHSDIGVDAAFVATDSGVTPTNTVHGTSTVLSTSINNSPVVGQAISKYGKTTHLTNGIIKSVNYSYTNAQLALFKNAIKTTMRAQGGDSGGVAFQPSVSGVTPNSTIGIMTAASSNGTQSLVAKASVINSKFDLSRY